MPNLISDEVREDAESILKVWTANPDFKLKDVNLEAFKTEADRYVAILAAIAEKEDALKPLRNDRDDTGLRLKALSTRARAGIRGYFGENSSEYEAVGGTRTSERKKTGRKAPAAPKPAP